LTLNLIFGVSVFVIVAVDSGLAVEREVLLGVGVEVELELFFEFEEERLSFNLSPFDPEVPEFEFGVAEELGPATFDLSSSMDLRRSSSSQSSSCAFPVEFEFEFEAWLLSWLLPPSLSLSLIGCGVE
jgi:hypothetical protein